MLDLNLVAAGDGMATADAIAQTFGMADGGLRNIHIRLSDIYRQETGEIFADADEITFKGELRLVEGANIPGVEMENTDSGVTWRVTSASDGQFRITEVGVTTWLSIDATTGAIKQNTTTTLALVIDSTHANGGYLSLKKSATAVLELGAAAALAIGTGNQAAINAPAGHLYIQAVTAANSEVRVESNSHVRITAATDLRIVTTGGYTWLGTHNAIGAETVTGYIEIKDTGGTVRKLAVVS